MIRAFWRRPSALTAIGGFSVAIAILSVAITASIVLLMPDPPAVRLTLADAAATLRGAENGLVRSIGAPPAGPPNPIQQQVLAQALGRPVGDVRVVWLDVPPRKRPVGEVIVLTPTRGRGSPFRGGTMVLQMKGGRPMRVVDRLPDGPLGTVLLRLPQPPFAAGVRLSDGRWLTVRPAAPLLGGWRWKVLVALAVSLVMLAPLAWLFARRLTRPFRVLARAIDATRAQSPIAETAPLVYLSPRGRPLTQDLAREFAACSGLVLVCGRFEGVDQRVLDARDVREVSIGDFVLSGGEPAALVLLDAVLRLLPGVIGDPQALSEESFAQGLLEYPHFTRPQSWEGRSVPEVLLSGHHARIATWRRERAEELTRQRRPDLWARYTETGGEAGPARKDEER